MVYLCNRQFLRGYIPEDYGDGGASSVICDASGIPLEQTCGEHFCAEQACGQA